MAQRTLLYTLLWKVPNDAHFCAPYSSPRQLSRRTKFCSPTTRRTTLFEHTSRVRLHCVSLFADTYSGELANSPYFQFATSPHTLHVWHTASKGGKQQPTRNRWPKLTAGHSIYHCDRLLDDEQMSDQLGLGEYGMKHRQDPLTEVVTRPALGSFLADFGRRVKPSHEFLR